MRPVGSHREFLIDILKQKIVITFGFAKHSYENLY